MKTLAVALDAAEWWYLERLLRAGRLPNLAALLDRSLRCLIQNGMAYRSELVWARFLTGREPLSDREWPVCTTFDPATYEHGSRGVSQLSPFYAGIRRNVIAFDLIHSSLCDEVDGTQITAWGAHSPQYPRASVPSGLLAQIDARFGPSPAFGNDLDLGWYVPGYIENLTPALATAAHRRVDAANWLMATHPDWDLFLTCMSEIHGGGHHFWHGVDGDHPLHGCATSELAARSLDGVTEATDAALGRLVRGLPTDTNVVVFALHGMAPADDVVATVLLPDILHRYAFGTSLLRNPDPVAWRRDGCPPVQPGARETWGSYMADRFHDRVASRLRSSAASTLPPALVHALRRAIGKGVVPPGELRASAPHETEVTPEALAAFQKPVDFQVLSWYQRHWPKMPAFALPSFADGHVRINLEGREAAGVVPASAYHMMCRDIIELLESCRDARTGQAIVDDVLWMRRDDPFDPSGPDADLLVIWRGAPDAVSHPRLGIVGPFPALRTGYHSANGFMLVSGPGIEPRDLGVRPAEDVTATVLSLLGEARPVASGHSVVAQVA